jgi:hypothetical protein
LVIRVHSCGYQAYDCLNLTSETGWVVTDHLRIASLAYKNKFAKTTSLANEKKFHSTLRVKKTITTSFACFRLIGQVPKKSSKTSHCGLRPL